MEPETRCTTLNKYTQIEYGTAKYPDVVFNFDATEEEFGYEYFARKQLNDYTGVTYCDDNDDPPIDPLKQRSFQI